MRDGRHLAAQGRQCGVGRLQGRSWPLQPPDRSEKHYWIYPQNRYGHHPNDIKFRFPRQTVIYLSPHDDRVVYQASHVLHRSTDEGVTWETISGDLTAHEPE